MKKFFTLLLSLLILLSFQSQAQSHPSLSKRCEKVADYMEQIGWKQRSYTCRTYLLRASDLAHESALNLHYKEITQAYEQLIHVRNQIDYVRYDGCAYDYDLKLIQDEVRSIMKALAKVYP